jgi:MFS family permease
MKVRLAKIFRRRSKRPDPSRSAVKRLAISRFVSMAGTDASGVAIGFALYAQTHSAQWLSMSLLVTLGTQALLAPLGGRAGDLFDRRRLMIAAELTSAALFIALAVLHTPVALLGIGFLASSIGTVFGPASGAAIGHLAGERHLSWANALIATGANLGKTAGRLGAGALIAVLGASSVFLVDAATFLASAVLIASVHLAFSDHRPARREGRADGQPSGMRFMMSHEKIKLVVLSAAISTFATAFTMTAEVPLVFELHAGAVGLGALAASWGAGMIVGSWWAGRVLHRDNEATGVLVGRLAMAAGIGLVAASPTLVPALACYLLGGVGGGFMGVAVQSLILRNAPDHLRARTLGAIDACRNVASGLGVIGAGVLVELVGPRHMYGIVGIVLVLGTLPVLALVMRLGGPRALRPAGAPAVA